MIKFAAISLLALHSLIGSSIALADETPPAAPALKSVPFEEIHRLIRQHLADTTDEDLNAAAVKGLIEQLKPHVALGQPPSAAESTNALVLKAERFRKDFGYLRAGVVRPGLRAALREAIDKLLESGPLKGLVIDLRFTGGTDYAAAAQATGLFTDAEGPLLRIGDKEYLGGGAGEVILIPVMVLTNGGTSGAAEAFAGSLRHGKAGLLIGSKTSGEATLYEEFILSNGQTIRIASKPVQLGDGTPIARTGLPPDIQIATTAAEDRRHLADPFGEASAGSSGTPAPVPRRRVTEADLVRQRREGVPLQQIITGSADQASEATPTLKDPALVRALDMLKALSVVQSWKKEK